MRHGHLFDDVPADRRDAGLKSKPAGGGLELLVVAADGDEFGPDFDQVGAVDVGTNPVTTVDCPTPYCAEYGHAIPGPCGRPD